MAFYNLKVIEYSKQYHVRSFGRAVNKLNPIIAASKKLNKTIDQIKPVKIRKYTDDAVEAAAAHSVAVSKHRTIDAIYKYALANQWQGFVTLTFNPELVDSSDYDLCSLKVKNWLGNIKKRHCHDLKYIIVPELHSDKIKYHFHALFAEFNKMPLVDSGHKDNSGRVIYNLPMWTYGFSTMTLIDNESSDKAVSYIVKYISKDLCAALFGKKRYWVSRNLDKPIEREYSLPGDDLVDDKVVNSPSFVLDSVESFITEANQSGRLRGISSASCAIAAQDIIYMYLDK